MRVEELAEMGSMVNRIKGLRKIYCEGTSLRGEIVLVEARSKESGRTQEGSGSTVHGTKGMLRFVGSQCEVEVREGEEVQHLRGRAEGED